MCFIATDFHRGGFTAPGNMPADMAAGRRFSTNALHVESEVQQPVIQRKSGLDF
jgi:hypothetical protein